MALVVYTQNPAGLLAAIKKAINDRRVVTWEFDSDGDFTHTPQQWRNRAWMCPTLLQGALRFNILGTRQQPMSKEDYAVYHGRFLEMLMAHFDKDFSTASATALATAEDLIAPQAGQRAS